MRDVLIRVFTELKQDGDTTPGIASGLDALDPLLGPLKPGQVLIVGALSGIGKSALALNMALHAALHQSTSVAIFSAEMECDELATRALFTEARVDSVKVNRKRLIESEEWSRLTSAATYVATDRIHIDDRPDLSIDAIRSKVRRLKLKAKKASGPPLGLVVIDYLQLLDGRAGLPRNASREQEVAAIARGVKLLAKEAGLPVIALAQLNSDSEKHQKARKPRLNDLRESKALAQNADKVVLIHNPAAIERAEAYRDTGAYSGALPAENVDLIVAKNRGGSTGTVQCRFWPSYTLFESGAAS